MKPTFRFLPGHTKMTFTQHQQYSPVLDPLNSQASHAVNSMQGKRDEEDGNSEDNEGSDSSEPATTKITIQNSKQSNYFDVVVPQFTVDSQTSLVSCRNTSNQGSDARKSETFEEPYQLMSNDLQQPLSPQKLTTSYSNDTSSSSQTSPNKKKLQKKLWEVTSEIFLKILTEIQQIYNTQQITEPNHHSSYLKQKIMKFSRESLGLLRKALKNSPSVGQGERPHLELVNYFIAAQEILIKDQSCYSEAFEYAENALRLVDQYPELAELESIKHFTLSFGHILLKCGLLKKAERCLISLFKKYNQINQGQYYELRLLCLKIEYQRLLCLKVTDDFSEIEGMPSLDGLFLRLNLLIDEGQLTNAMFMIQQSLVVFKSPLIILSLKNLLLKIYLLQNQFTEFHTLMGEMKHQYHDNNLTKTIEYCNAIIIESQCLLVEAELENIQQKLQITQEDNIIQGHKHSTPAESKLKSSLQSIEEASEIARLILSDRYHQSSISGDIYQLKATILMELSSFQTHKKDKSKILKQALSLSQLAIHIRKNYLFSHCDKNTKVLESMHLQVDLLALTNRSRECRKASAELLEYELI